MQSTALDDVDEDGISANGEGLIILYGLLFGLLQAESYALLMGTLLCFVVLGLVMVLTRNVNWYERSSAKKMTMSQPDKPISKSRIHGSDERLYKLFLTL